jgi:hypothetical protein
MNENKPENLPAFPSTSTQYRSRASGLYYESASAAGSCDEVRIQQLGISTLDYFAAKAMAAQIIMEGMEGCDKELIVAMAYEMADAMLKERAKQL